MTSAAQFMLLTAIGLGCLLGSRVPASGQQGAGQVTHFPARDRKPSQKDDPLKSYLPREPSIRLPQR